MKREFLQGLKVGENPLPKDIIDAIMAQNGQDIQAARQASQDWEEKYNRAVEDHSRAMEAVRLQSALESAVNKAGGRNVKAIAALLDLQTIGKAEDLSAALDTALEELKRDSDYLFAGQTPPPYAKGTGLGDFSAPPTLAGALKERMRR